MAKDFRNKQFGRILRGYNPEEVDEYIAYISDEYRKLERRCANSERQLALALKNLDEMHRNAGEADVTAKNAAADEAKSEAERVIADAAARAEEIVAAARKDAETEAKKILGNAAKAAEVILVGAENDALENRQKADSLFRVSEKMYDEVCAFRDSLFDLYNTHIESIEQMTSEADRAMDGIRDSYEGNTADDGEICGDEPDEDPAEDPAAEPDEEIEESDAADEAEDEPDESAAEESVEEESPEETPAETDAGRIPMDLIVDLSDEDLYFDDSEENAEPDAAEDEFEEESYDADEGEPDESAGADDGTEDYSDEDYAELDMDGSFQIDWSSRYQKAESDEDDFAEEEETAEPAEETAFQNLDDMFTEESERELSLTDEFDLVFNGNNARKSVEEIRRQPTVAPEKPKNPKKHQKF